MNDINFKNEFLKTQWDNSFLTTEEHTIKWLDSAKIKNYTINGDMSVNVAGDVDIDEVKLLYIPVKFRYVSGRFNCFNNSLKSLKGCPEYVGSTFNCALNELTSLEYSPYEVKKHFICYKNKIESFKGITLKINENLNCSDNKIIDLQHFPTVLGDVNLRNNKIKVLTNLPKVIVGDFDCQQNELTSLVGSPEMVTGSFLCGNNQLKNLIGAPQSVGNVFNCNDNPIEKLELMGIKLEHFIMNSANLMPLGTDSVRWTQSELNSYLVSEKLKADLNEKSDIRIKMKI